MAAADYGEYGEDPPPEYKVAMLCDRWHTLPEAGGLLDQPAGLMERLTAVLNVAQTFQALKRSGDYAKFMEDNPEHAKLVQNVQKLRQQYHE